MIDFDSWGKFPKVSQKSFMINEFENLPWKDTSEYFLPRGNGRSYGDSCLIKDGTLLVTLKKDRFIEFDQIAGVIKCESGVLLSDILEIAVPRGWFLPVTPGTQYVTVGGAIANDVHGKNHHVAGSFGRHIKSFHMIRSDGQELTCLPGDEWLSATVAGLGLTGLIVWAEIQLLKIDTPLMQCFSKRFENIDSFFETSEKYDNNFNYSVSWFDCSSSGKNLGRGVYMGADHKIADNNRSWNSPEKHINIPFTPPFSMVNKLTLKPFNSLYYNKSENGSVTIQHYQPYFYPLDSIKNWNRLYGPKGFLQHQCVLPFDVAQNGLKQILKAISNSGIGSPLAVLKRFGNLESPGLLSFARPGVTLALDFPYSEETLRLLNRIDKIVDELNGAIYPAKDARMAPELFMKSYPEIEKFMKFRDPKIQSEFSRRMGI